MLANKRRIAETRLKVRTVYPHTFLYRDRTVSVGRDGRICTGSVANIERFRARNRVRPCGQPRSKRHRQLCLRPDTSLTTQWAEQVRVRLLYFRPQTRQ